MNRIIGRHLDDFMVVYLDDILVFSKNAEDHLKHLDIVLGILRRHKLSAKLSKCVWEVNSLPFLGHVLSADGIGVDLKKVAAVKEWPAPKNVGELRSFLGLANYFRRFMQGFAKRAAPLTSLLRKEAPYIWSTDCREAFEGLKNDLSSAQQGLFWWLLTTVSLLRWWLMHAGSASVLFCCRVAGRLLSKAGSCLLLNTITPLVRSSYWHLYMP